MTEHPSLAGRLLQEGWHELQQPCLTSLGLSQAEHAFNTAHQTVLCCKATDLDHLWLLVGSMDVAALRLVWGGSYTWHRTSTYAAVLSNGSMAADIVDLMSRLTSKAGQRVGNITSANSLNDENVARQPLQNMALLLELLATLWSQAHNGFRTSTAVNPTALLGPYIAGMVPSSSCSALLGVARHLLDRLLEPDVPRVIAAAAVAGTCLIRLMTASEAAFNAAGGAAAAAQLLPSICYLVRPDGPRQLRVQSICAIMAAILADAVAMATQGPLWGMRDVLRSEPSVPCMLLDVLPRMVKSSNSGWLLKVFASAHMLLSADPEMSILDGLYVTLSAKAAWPCPPPVSEAHMTALRSLASARAHDLELLRVLCQLGTEFLPRMASLGASASGRAFLDAAAIASVALRGAARRSWLPLNRAVFTLLESFLSGQDGHGVPPKAQVSRASWIVRQGFIQQCEALVRRPWRSTLAGEASADIGDPPLCLEGARSLLRMAMFITQSLGSELCSNYPALAVVLSAVATVRKVLCHAARTTAAARYVQHYGHVTGRGDKTRGVETPLALRDSAGSFTRAIELGVPEILDFVTAVLRDPPQLLDLTHAAAKTHAELQCCFALQLVPPVAHVVHLMHASLSVKEQWRLLRVLFGWARHLDRRQAGATFAGYLFAHLVLVAQLKDLIIEVVTAMLERPSCSQAQREARKAALAKHVGRLASAGSQRFLSVLVQRLALLVGSSDDSSSSPEGLPAAAASRNTTAEECDPAKAATCGDPSDPLAGWHTSWDSLALAVCINTGRHLGCWCRGCCNFSEDSERGLRLRRCGGCRRAWYCSAACQRRAWRAGHRPACLAWQQDHVGDQAS